MRKKNGKLKATFLVAPANLSIERNVVVFDVVDERNRARGANQQVHLSVYKRVR